jgi:hypothetical protein
LAERESPTTAIPIATLEKLKALVGGDGSSSGAAANALDALFQVRSEIK